MYCKNCGEEIDDRAVVCIKCGVPTEIHPVNDEFSGISIAAIICAFFCAPCRLYLGAYRHAKCKKSKEQKSCHGRHDCGIGNYAYYFSDCRY